MLIKIASASLSGVEGCLVTVETDLRRGMPEFSVVGLADTTIRESCKRIQPAVINSGFSFPNEKLTVNLAPAAKPKEGSHFDLPIAAGIILLMEGIEPPEDTAMLGEVSLDGSVNPVRGVLPLVIALRKSRIRRVLLPAANAEEAAVLEDMEILPAESILQVIRYLKGELQIDPCRGGPEKPRAVSGADFSQVIGQESVKRAMIIGAAGNHGMLMVGSPGCGKTMIARRLPGILPPLTYDERLEIMGIYSVAGLLPAGHPVISERPFRSPHHSITLTGLIGGGARPRPGEMSLAHRGVLFLDELGEFDSRTVDGLRQPLEDGYVRIMRRQEEMIFPCSVLLLAAANPCKCGHLWDDRKLCSCTPKQLAAYRRKLSGPFSDRIDMHIRMTPVDREVLIADKGSAWLSTGEMRSKVEQARQRQRERYRMDPVLTNGRLDEAGIRRFCRLDRSGSALLALAYEKMGLSMRGYHKILKIARTIADIEGSERILEEHAAEALQYRVADMEGGR